MKKNFFLTALILTVITLPLHAHEVLTSGRSTSEEYLKNYGHSDIMIDMIQHTKAKANGEAYVPQQQQVIDDDFFLVRWCKKVFMYLDPALDNGTFMNHDIKTIPGSHDL